MKAIDFVKNYGIDYAKKAIENVAWCETAYCVRLKHGCFKTNSDCCVDIKELKQIVDAFELVESYGSIKQAKYFLSICADWIKPSLEQAIKLMEQCQ